MDVSAKPQDIEAESKYKRWSGRRKHNGVWRQWMNYWINAVLILLKFMLKSCQYLRQTFRYRQPEKYCIQPTAEKEMATHYSILAWRIPGTEEPGGQLSVGSHRVRHNWSNLAHVHLSLMCAIYEFEHIQLPMISSWPSRGETHSTSQISLVSLCICFVVLTLDIKAAF